MSVEKKKIGLLIIATNKYIKFLNNLLVSANAFFCSSHEVTFFIFTDRKIEINKNIKHKIINTTHKPWPWMTLGRYEIFYNNKNELSKMDYLYYCDVDMKFVSEVGSEILGDRVATQHPGYVGRRGTPETNPKSLACIRDDEPMTYFAGGFNGGSSAEYLKMCNIISTNIQKDFENGIIAIWHDESHMNRYFVNNAPTVILSSEYCCPEMWDMPKRKLLALDKNHEEVRL